MKGSVPQMGEFYFCTATLASASLRQVCQPSPRSRVTRAVTLSCPRTLRACRAESRSAPAWGRRADAKKAQSCRAGTGRQTAGGQREAHVGSRQKSDRYCASDWNQPTPQWHGLPDWLHPQSEYCKALRMPVIAANFLRLSLAQLVNTPRATAEWLQTGPLR
jgi:hypothetical protein